MSLTPKVFISYSWDDEAHKTWVRSLATQLRSDGVDITLDQWHAVPGDKLPEFMEKAVRESDFVLIVCTPKYRERSDERVGGVGYEGDVMTAEVLTKRNDRKFIPILCHGDWDTSCPTWLRGKYYVDLRDATFPNASYQELLNTLHGTMPVPPPIGERPLTIPIPSPDGHTAPNPLSTTPMRDSLTIVVPVYNEARTIRDSIKGLKAEGLLGRYPTMFCDDGSQDGSFEIIKECVRGIPGITCLRNKFNTRKVGAIDRMVSLVRTKFVLTLDADCAVSELKQNALEDLMLLMTQDGYSASCFRIVPSAKNWFGRLQKLDYAFFTDALRSILRIPLCLIGQGVLWKTNDLIKVLSLHSGKYHGDDLENTVIALNVGMKIHWERNSLIVITEPKRTILGLIKQRALSWDYGMLRVLFGKRALRIGGESGAFYKNLLLWDVVAHPFKLMAAPLLLSVPLFSCFGSSFYDGFGYDLFRKSFAFSLKFGALGILTILALGLFTSFVCSRRLLPTVRFFLFSLVYLSSPFVYIWFYPIIMRGYVNVYDTLGAAIHFLGVGLLITYLWWVLLSLCLLLRSSLEPIAKAELFWSVLLSPLYFFVLLVLCKTAGMCKYAWCHLIRR